MKKIIFSLLILVLIFTVPACKKSDENYNVVGSWQFTMSSGNYNEGPYKTDFVGDATQGTWKMYIDLNENEFIAGTYEVVGNVIKMIITYVNYEGGLEGYFTGQFEKYNKISGTWRAGDDGRFNSGTWVAIR